MSGLIVGDLVRGAQAALLGGRVPAEVSGVSIDSRTVNPGEAFVAVRGPRQDGHAYVAAARARGASAAIVDRLPPDVEPGPDFAIVLVDDTTLALQRLAAYHRRRHDLPVVGITGSNGKTTTKELTALALGAGFRVHKAAGSFNNQWGLPLTLLGLRAGHQAAVVELGMNAFGEIAALAQLAQPGIGVVTTISAAHLLGVGSIEGVQKVKGELVEAIPVDGLVVLNADDPLVLALAGRARGRVTTFGEGPDSDLRLGPVRVTEGGLVFPLTAGRETVEVRLPLAGRHNAWNAAAAASVALHLGVPLRRIAEALQGATPVKGRLAWTEAGGVRVLDDTYNANPTSLRAALLALHDAGPGGRAWVVLGDMLELGPEAETAHREAGAWVAARPVAGLVTVGAGMREAAAVARAAGCPGVASFDDPDQAVLHLVARLQPGDRVLVKGSRGMRMERAIAALLGRLSC
jgi:UDP-N-acetylmuramoyl-tripeptide--D-alanyl-D-alanine ligase